MIASAVGMTVRRATAIPLPMTINSPKVRFSMWDLRYFLTEPRCFAPGTRTWRFEDTPNAINASMEAVEPQLAGNPPPSDEHDLVEPARPPMRIVPIHLLGRS